MLAWVLGADVSRSMRQRGEQDARRITAGAARDGDERREYTKNVCTRTRRRAKGAAGWGEREGVRVDMCRTAGALGVVAVRLL